MGQIEGHTISVFWMGMSVLYIFTKLCARDPCTQRCVLLSTSFMIQVQANVSYPTPSSKFQKKREENDKQSALKFHLDVPLWIGTTAPLWNTGMKQFNNHHLKWFWVWREHFNNKINIKTFHQKWKTIGTFETWAMIIWNNKYFHNFVARVRATIKRTLAPHVVHGGMCWEYLSDSTRWQSV